MRITPLDIRKQEFRKTMRGLDTDEVYAFLGTVADEYEAVLSDNKRLREHIVQLEERVKEFKGMEKNLRNTLMTAERVTSEAKENARKEADLIVRGAEVDAEKAAEAIRAHTQQLRREILELKKHKDNYVTRLKTLLESHKGVINGFEEDFAEVDREIEAIGRKVEEDSTAPIKAPRMSREKITEDFAHQTDDKVTWGDDGPAEEVERPHFPRPGQWEQQAQPDRKTSLPEDDSGMPGPQGSSQKIEKKVQNSAELNFGPAAQPAGSSAVDGENVARRVVESSYEQKLYPEMDDTEAKAEEADQAGAEMQEPEIWQGPGRQQVPAPEAAVEDQADADSPATATAVEPEMQQAEQQDEWKSYEVKEKKTDWTEYNVPRSEAPAEQPPEAGKEKANKQPSDTEVEEALSGLTDSSPDEGTSSGNTWSMEDLRRNMTNIDREDG
jgi:cell division initiation protein